MIFTSGHSDDSPVLTPPQTLRCKSHRMLQNTNRAVYSVGYKCLCNVCCASTSLVAAMVLSLHGGSYIYLFSVKI